MGVEIWDDFVVVVVGRVVRNVFLKFGIGIGVVLIMVIEIIMVIVDICKEYVKWRGGVLIKIRKEFIVEVVDKVILVFFCIGGSIVGMIVG